MYITMHYEPGRELYDVGMNTGAEILWMFGVSGAGAERTFSATPASLPLSPSFLLPQSLVWAVPSGPEERG